MLIRAIEKAPVCRLGLSLNDIPYVVPVCFGYKDNCLYVHSAGEGKKIDILKKNNSVCFEIDADAEVVVKEEPCGSTMKYHSVIGFGKAYFIEPPDEKRKAFDIMMEKYSPRKSFNYPDIMLKRVTVLKIEISEMSGKKSVYQR